MLHAKHRHWLVILVASCLLPGCSTLMSRPDAKVLDKFADVDAIELSGEGNNRMISDPEVIARMRSVYSSAKWKPYVGTVPARMRHIKCLRDGQKEFSLQYAGYLMEGDYDKKRYAAISGADRDWLNRLFATDQVSTSPDDDLSSSSGSTLSLN